MEKFISELGSSPEDAEAMRKHVFGANYRTDARGNPIEMGIGSDVYWASAKMDPSALTNHLAGIERTAGKEAADGERARITAIRRAAGFKE